MRNSLVIKRGGVFHHFDCSSKNCKSSDDNESIPYFYSEEHALDSGWLKTLDPLWCPPNKPYVWVCPECIKRFLLQ